MVSQSIEVVSEKNQVMQHKEQESPRMEEGGVDGGQNGQLTVTTMTKVM